MSISNFRTKRLSVFKVFASNFCEVLLQRYTCWHAGERGSRQWEKQLERQLQNDVGSCHRKLLCRAQPNFISSMKLINSNVSVSIFPLGIGELSSNQKTYTLNSNKLSLLLIRYSIGGHRNPSKDVYVSTANSPCLNLVYN